MFRVNNVISIFRLFYSHQTEWWYNCAHICNSFCSQGCILKKLLCAWVSCMVASLWMKTDPSRLSENAALCFRVVSGKERTLHFVGTVLWRLSFGSGRVFLNCLYSCYLDSGGITRTNLGGGGWWPFFIQSLLVVPQG